jgi:predicted nucleic acid-binding protein
MPLERVVVNASPLIVLFKSGQAELLPQLFGKILVPQAVWDEVTAAPNDMAAQQLLTATWATPVEVEVDSAIAGWDLGAGESAVLSFALQNPPCRAMVDDAAARRCARSLGILTLGSGGAMVLAKQRGIVPSVGDRECF